MKFKVSLTSFEVSEFTKEDEARCQNNGQHLQLPGYAIASVEARTCKIEITLYHPETKPSTGHYDLMVDFTASHLFFRIYTNFQRILLGDDALGNYWPSGQRCLVKTTLALDEYLEKMGFRLGIWNRVVSGLDA